MSKNLVVVRAKDSDKLYLKDTVSNKSVRFFTDLSELQNDSKWRLRVIYCEGEFGTYARLIKEEIETLDV